MGSGGADFQDSHRFLHFSAVTTFISLAEEYRQRRGYKDTEVKWFLSTDSSKVERNLTKLFPDRVIGMETFRRGHSSQEKSNRNGFYRAVLDVAVLSRCEFMVLTNHSSFGMIARMLTTRPSFAIVPARNYLAVCWRDRFRIWLCKVYRVYLVSWQFSVLLYSTIMVPFCFIHATKHRRD